VDYFLSRRFELIFPLFPKTSCWLLLNQRSQIQTDGDLVAMPKVHPRLIVAVCTVALTAVCSLHEIRAQRSAIDTYAITNARIVTVSGPIIDRGTVVIRNGLIAAAGPNVSAPPDARIIDGAGLTV
jgi:hypothetical protein